MRRRRASGHGAEEGPMDLAPMLDFVLNLLIFFIISATFSREIGITLSSPSAKAAQSKEAGSILIAIRDSGEIFMDRRVVDLRAVRANIERLHAEKPEDVVVIIAERAAPTGVLVQVVDQVKLGGVENISFAAAGNKS